ncbi:hypothetical protein Mapa_003985 [Marchantia paleacea]|nr:hypothetical protein Mapa_003985 [Marchantia paleacea]
MVCVSVCVLSVRPKERTRHLLTGRFAHSRLLSLSRGSNSSSLLHSVLSSALRYPSAIGSPGYAPVSTADLTQPQLTLPLKLQHHLVVVGRVRQQERNLLRLQILGRTGQSDRDEPFCWFGSVSVAKL